MPEWNGGTVPNEAPVHYKPEFQGGIPGIPEVRELPPFEGGVIPNDAPILDLPELEIPVEPEKPSTPKEVPSKPSDAPKEKGYNPTAVSYKLDSEPKEAVNTPVYGGVLPNTGEKEGIASTLGIVVIAAGITALTLGFKRFLTTVFGKHYSCRLSFTKNKKMISTSSLKRLTAKCLS